MTAATPQADGFERVARVARGLAGVSVITRYNGTQALTLDGVFLAAMAVPAQAEPNSLVVRCAIEDRSDLTDDAPDIYYVNAAHARHPVVLVRLDAIDDAALRDVLAMSWRLTRPKTARGRRRQAGATHRGSSRISNLTESCGRASTGAQPRAHKRDWQG